MSQYAVLFAVAAAFAWWSMHSRRAAAVPPPPVPSALPPLTSPSIASASGPGMLTIAAVAIPWCVMAYFVIAAATAPGNPSPPSPTTGLDLRGAWRGEHAAEDAAITETILRDLAWFIEDDGKQSEPRLKSGQQLAELRMRARQGATHGVSLAERQPRAIDAISAFLDREIGDKGGPLEAGDRERWVKAFREVSEAARISMGR